MADFDPFTKKEKAPGYGSLDESEVSNESSLVENIFFTFSTIL